MADFDADDLRKIPQSWKDYLKDTANMIAVIGWVYRELIPKTSHLWTKKFLTASVVMVLFQLAQPWTISHIFNGLNESNFNLILYGVIGFILCAAIQKLANWYESRAREYLIGINFGSVDHRITALFFEKSMGQHLQEGSSLHVSNIDKGRWRTFELMCMLLFEGVPVLLLLFVSFLFLWILSPLSGLVMTIVMIIYCLWSLFLNQQVATTCYPIDADYRKLNRHRVERWEKMERVKTNGKEQEELQHMDKWWDRIIIADRKFWLWFIRHHVYRNTISLIGLILIMIYGIWSVWNNQWPLGKLYPLFSWATLLSFNLWQVSRLEHQLNWNLPSVKAMKEALMIKPDVIYKKSAPVIYQQEPVGVVFDNVSYTYPSEKGNGPTQEQKSPIPVIKNISFSIAAGEKVALIGDSGAGKTTLMRLLLRYMDPDEGHILINGHKLHQVNLPAWMHMIGYIPQQAQVLDGTIRYNLTYGLSKEQRQQMSDDSLWEIMRLLQIDFGKRLVDGLDTVVGRNGMKLSGGQAQRLMIGAAAIKKPQFMIIDEATSSLDSTTEKKVQHGLAEVLSGNVSALVIAHRLSTIRDLCDRFVVIREASSIVNQETQVEAESTSFEGLYSISPTFRRLADDQGVTIEDNSFRT